MYGSDVWAIRVENKYKYCNLGGFYIIAMRMLRQESSTKEDWNIAAKRQFTLDYKELQQMLQNNPSIFKEVNNLNQVKKLKGDCVFLTTPDTTLISTRHGDNHRFISVRKDLEEAQLQIQQQTKE